MTVHITSDLHFNHANIITFCDRPFVGVRHMNEMMIDYWNAIVTDRDDIYVVGDFGFDNSVAPIDEIFAALKGRKHLIVGNHDERNEAVMKLPWTTVQWYLKLRWEGRKAILSHYPFETWDGAAKGVIHLHGHSHGSLKRQMPHRFDVGVDVTQTFAPMPISHFFDWADAQGDYDPTDHHGD